MKFHGAMAAAITPSRDDAYHMNAGGALEVIDFLAGHHVSGIALFGATGEFPHFLPEDRMRLTNMAVKRSRVPVIVNVTHSNFEDVVTMAEHAAEHGAAGVMAQPPIYFRYGAGEIRQFYLELLEELDGFPTLLYHLPAFNNAVPAAVSLELLRSGVAIGIKDSSGDWEYFAQLAALRREREFCLLVGNDLLLTRGLAAGADGFISGCACAVPELLTAIDRVHRAGDTARLQQLGALLDEFLGWIDQFPGPYGIREALRVRKLPVGSRAIPFSPETEAKATSFRAWFEDWLPGVQRAASA